MSGSRPNWRRQNGRVVFQYDNKDDQKFRWYGVDSNRSDGDNDLDEHVNVNVNVYIDFDNGLIWQKQ